MALQVAASQFALHRTSNKVSKYIKDGSKTGLQGVYTATKYNTTTESALQPIIPSADIFEGLKDNTAHENGIPSAFEYAVHLEFLAVLHKVHQRIVESEALDEVFNIKPNKRTVIRKGEEVQLKDDTLWTRKQAKWDRYLELAVVRFITWMKIIPQTYAVKKDETPKCTRENLPPIDVLMVWHSFLLNPRWFRKSCSDGKKLLNRIEFPWALIISCIPVFCCKENESRRRASVNDKPNIVTPSTKESTPLTGPSPSPQSPQQPSKKQQISPQTSSKAF